MIEIARIKWGSINDQIITCLVKMEEIATTTTFNGGFRGCIGIRVEIVAYKTRESDAVCIGIFPLADNLKNILSSVSTFKLNAKGRICFQLVQKSGSIISDVAAPRNVGNLKVFNIITLNFTREDLESAERVPFGDVPLSACKRRDRHAHTMATASSAASSFLITFFIMICESLLSSFSDSYFQGLLPAQNQFCRRVRKDAVFLTCLLSRLRFLQTPHTRAASISAPPPAVYSLVPAPPVEGSS